MGLQSHASEAGLQCIKLPTASKCTCGAGFGGGAEAAAKCRRWCGSGFGRSLAPTLITIICWTIVFNEPLFIIMPFDHSREVLDIADRESHHVIGRLRSPQKIIMLVNCSTLHPILALASHQQPSIVFSSYYRDHHCFQCNHHTTIPSAILVFIIISSSSNGPHKHNFNVVMN